MPRKARFLSRPGELFTDLPASPPRPTPSAVCVECGASFPAPVRTGRPHRYCSDACRHTNWSAQRKAWVAAQNDACVGAAICRHCGSAFTPAPRLAGRLPHFCGLTCRRLAKKPAPRHEPGLFD